MKTLSLLSILLLTACASFAQIICDPAGNVMIYSNYEGGTLNVEVDVDIPNLKIGICTYEPVTVNFTGTYVGNITEVLFAGFNEPLAITGVPAGIVTTYACASGNVAISPYLSEYEILGVPIANCMVGAEDCTDYASGGGNSSPQIVQFFLAEFGPGNIFYAHYTDYVFFPPGVFQISEGGNCCLDTPLGAPNPIYTGGITYNFLPDTLLLCDDDITLDISFYETLWGTTTWSTGATGPTITVDAPGVYSFTMWDYCHYDPDNLLTDTVVIIPCYTLIDTAICDGASLTLPDGSVVTDAGEYIVTIPAVDGSDSTISVTVSLWPEYFVSITGAICDGDAYLLPDGTSVTVPGVYTIVLPTVTGCDSTIQVTLNVSASFTTTVAASICSGDAYLLPDGTFATVAGTYIANLLTASGCDSTITTNLSVNPVYTFILDTTICTGETVTLPDGTIASTAGVYELDFTTTLGCDSIFFYYVDFYPLTTVTTNIADVWCLEDGVVLLEADPAGGVFSGPGVSGAEFDPAVAGTGDHTITYAFTDAFGCFSVISETITVEQNFADAGLDTTIFDSGVASLEGVTGGNYLWSPPDGLTCTDCPDPFTGIDFTTTYYLSSVSANGCVAIDSVTVFVIPSNEEVFIPNTFTPNGDGINDGFNVLAPGVSQLLEFSIYDRWGERIWIATDTDPLGTGATWDGTFKGEDVNQGVYAYLVRVQFYSGRIERFAGNVTLIR